MSKAIAISIISFLFLALISIAIGQSQWKKEYFVKPGGIYTFDRNTNTYTPFIRLGDSQQTATSQMGRKADSYGTNTNAFAYVEDKNIEPCGLIFYTYAVIIPPEYEYGIGQLPTIQNTTSAKIESIGIYSPQIRTVKGIGVGSTIKELYDTHGKPSVDWYYYDSNGWCLEYAMPEGRIYFSIGQQYQIAETTPIGAIYLTY